MILILPLDYHLLESSDDVQLISQYEPLRSYSSAARGCYTTSLPSQAAQFANEQVTCPSQQAVSLPAIQSTDFVALETVSVLVGQAMKLVAVGTVFRPARQETKFALVLVVSLAAGEAMNFVEVVFASLSAWRARIFFGDEAVSLHAG